MLFRSVTGALTLESLVQLNNNDTDGAVTNAIQITAAAGTITNAFNVNDAEITNAFVTPNATISMTELEFLDGGTRTDEALCTYETTGNQLECDVNSEATLETALGSLDVVAVSTDDITTANLYTLLSDEGGANTVLHGSGGWSAIVTGDITDGTIAQDDIDDTATLAGNPAFANNAVWFATTGIIFEGSSGGADTIEGLLTAANPTSTDKTWTLPNETGTICTTGSVCTGYQASLGFTPVNVAEIGRAHV